MCGVIGFSVDNVTKKDIDLLKRLFKESMIRGKHATGMAYYDGEKIIIEKYPVAAKTFIDVIDEKIIFNNKIRLIGHVRYSTSDLEYNQPIGDNEFAIVHNGIISQEPFEKWKDLYPEFSNCKTKNDSELLFNYLKKYRSPDMIPEWFPGASYSVCSLDKNGNILNFRNGLRPQWIYQDERMKIIASTLNILIRSGLDNPDKIQKVLSIDEDLIKHKMGKNIEC